VVVQCPTCQSKFRIADDKVTDRGVRVRCTSCKNVFQVRKPGAAASEQAPGPGNTMDLSSLDAAQVARPSPRAAAPSPARPASPAARPPPPPSRPAPASRPPAAVRSPNGTARRLEADDLFGMAELTGDAPLGEMAPKAPPPPSPASRPPPAAARSPAKPMPNFDDIDIDVPDEPAAARPPPPPPPKASQPPPPPEESAPPPPPTEDEAPPPEDEAGPVKLGAFKTAMKDPFEGMNLGEPGTGALDLSTQPKKEKLAELPAMKIEPPKPPEPELPPARAMVSSALTGLLGAALAVAVIIASAVSDDAAAGWLGLTPRSEVVATRVVSGLYDTVAGKPVFFVRGRVENRGSRVHGPFRVTAELVSDGAAEAKAEAIAGAEPTPEDVWSLRSNADVERLSRSLDTAEVQRKLQPGGSLPFFAVIPDPPPDLGRHRLHVKVESVDAWNPIAPPKAAKGK